MKSFPQAHPEPLNASRIVNKSLVGDSDQRFQVLPADGAVLDSVGLTADQALHAEAHGADGYDGGCCGRVWRGRGRDRGNEVDGAAFAEACL